MPRRLFGVLLAALIGSAACSGPAPTVDQITVANPTDYDLEIHVTREDRGGWLPMIIVEAAIRGRRPRSGCSNWDTGLPAEGWLRSKDRGGG